MFFVLSNAVFSNRCVAKNFGKNNLAVACGQGMQVMGCMTKFLDEFLRVEVDIVEFDEKYYLFRMKSEADPKRRSVAIAAFLCLTCLL